MDTGRRAKAYALGISLALVVITGAAYRQTIANGFIKLDDPDYVTANPRVQAGLTPDSVKWAFTSFHSSNWHPVTWLSHMLDCQWFGLNPAGHHAVSVALHVLNTVLVFGLLRSLTGSLWRSAFAAALFGLHPLHVESVAWISERKDVLSTCFGLLSLWAYSVYAKRRQPAAACSMETPSNHSAGKLREVPGAARWIFYAAALGCLALGLMSKPMLVTLPFVMLLLDFWPLRRIRAKEGKLKALTVLAIEKLPFFALVAASSIVTFKAQQLSGSVVSITDVPLESRFTHPLLAYAAYLGKTLWPANLAVFYPYSTTDAGGLLAGGAVLLLLLITLGGWFLANRGHGWALCGWLWFLGTLVPVIGIVQVGRQDLADRYTYLPHIGLFVGVVWGVAKLAGRWKWGKALAIGLGCAAVLCLGARTAAQVTYWKDSRTLFTHAAEVTRGNYMAHAVLATILVEEGKLSEAAEHGRTALQFLPGYPEAHTTLGSIYARQGNLDAALGEYQAAIRSDPRSPEAYVGSARVLADQGRMADAETQSREALRWAPLSLEAWWTLAFALQGQGKFDEAISCYQRLLLLQPANRLPLYHMAVVSQSAKDPIKAIQYYRQALEAFPDRADIMNNLAWLLAVEAEPGGRNSAEAIRFAEQACALTSKKEPLFLGTLAAAYAEAGRFPEAIATAEAARDLALKANLKEVAERNEAFLKLYRAGKPAAAAH